MQITALPSTTPARRDARTRLYRVASLSMAVTFAVVGLIFLVAPGSVTAAFDALSLRAGLATVGATAGFYLILAVAYMYLVTVLAGWMYLRPANPTLPVLLINAKAASSLLSFGVFAFGAPALIYLANGIIDGLIAVGVWLLYREMQREQMNLIIEAANLYMPAPVKRRGLLELFAITATAFECDAPHVAGVSHSEMLRAYALFTAEQAGQALERSADPREIQDRLYAGACRMGANLRHAFRITNDAEALAAAKVLYRALGIHLSASPRGQSGAEVTVRRCFFSDYYTRDTCRLIASLDAGLFAGLSGGGRLEFYRRITEGATCCKAHFRA